MAECGCGVWRLALRSLSRRLPGAGATSLKAPALRGSAVPDAVRRLTDSSTAAQTSRPSDTRRAGREQRKERLPLALRPRRAFMADRAWCA